MLTDLTEDLVSFGWDVTVVTSDALYRDDRTRLAVTDEHRGVRIRRIRSTRLQRFALLGRTVDSLGYMAGATRLLLTGPRPDIAVAMTDPPMMMAPFTWAAHRRGAAAVYWAQDLFPQIAGELGVLDKHGAGYRALARTARAASARSDTVIALGERMAQRAIADGAPAEGTRVVHNWADTSAIRPLPQRESSLYRQLGLEGRFVVLYAGNAGRAHDFGSTVQAARELESRDDIAFVFVGSGPRLPELKRALQGLRNAHFVPPVPRDRLADCLAVASASLVTEAPAVAGLLVPSKTYGILASGRPILFVGSSDSDVAALIKRHGCGAAVDAADAPALVRQILAWQASPSVVTGLGERARGAAAEYDRHRATKAWAAAVEPLLNPSRTPGQAGIV
jgi:colanic acid biosynthesis glycosyl transferase WcaI